MNEVGIYQIRNMVNNKIYIGSSVTISIRWKTHKNELNKNKHHSSKLQDEWNKFGEDSFVFEILEIIDNDATREELSTLEQEYIDKFKPHENGYNVSYRVTGTPMKTHKVAALKRKYEGYSVERPVRKIGNSLGVLLPKDYLNFMNLSNGSLVNIIYQDGRIIIETVYED